MTNYLNLSAQEQNNIWKNFVLSKPCTNEEKEAFLKAKRLLSPEVYDSWLSSKKNKVDPFTIKPRTLTPEKLEAVLERNKLLIDISIPYMEQFMQFFDSEHYAVTIADTNCTMIALTGGIGKGVHKNITIEHLKVGIDRSENYSGTNGIALCMKLQKPIQIIGAEHYVQSQRSNTSSAAPIYDTDGNILGCFNVFGETHTTHPHTLGMVVTAANWITKELQLRQSYNEMSIINKQLSTTLQLTNLGLIMSDSDSIIRQHNHLAEQLLGLSYDQIHNHHLSEIMRMNDTDFNFVSMKKDFRNREMIINLQNNKRVSLNVSATIISNENNDNNGLVITLEAMKQVRKFVKQASGFNSRYTFDSIIGTSDPLMSCKKLGEIASQSFSNVLILGESGTGKELFAHAIHSGSDRKNNPFIAINCASLPKDLIESELFGYVGGAFTGANKQGQPGKFELADSGTIFLDEIGDMPLNLQASLLRVLQSDEVVRIGGKTSKPVDVRIIAATNHDLSAAISKQEFRQDLYYRLNVLSLTIPPLRERLSDLPILIDHFIMQYAHLLNKMIRGIAPDAMQLLSNYSWPGNVRELENIIERSVNIAQEIYIQAGDLPLEIQAAGSASKTERPLDPPRNPVSGNLKDNEYDLIVKALTRTAGNIKRSSELLGIGRRTLYYKIERYQIDVNRYRSTDSLT